MIDLTIDPAELRAAVAADKTIAAIRKAGEKELAALKALALLKRKKITHRQAKVRRRINEIKRILINKKLNALRSEMWATVNVKVKAV